MFRRRTTLLLCAAALLCHVKVAQGANHSAGHAQKTPGPSKAPTAGCSSEAVLPKGASRIFIALRNGNDGSGTSMADARDGSTPARFDSILRCYSEGCTSAARPIAKTENLLVCLGPGVFRTKGSYDFLIGVPHKTQEGFTLGKGWKVHGQGEDKTTLQLSAYLRMTDPNDQRNYPLDTGMNTVFSTNSDDASGIEISDLTVDANFPELKSIARQNGVKALNLEAIHLRSNYGGNWIHNVKVIHAAGEVGSINVKYETFPVWIYSVRQGVPPSDNAGNIIENVTMTDFSGGLGTAIAVANAVGEVRNNMVDGYQIGYGGWSMGPVWFHDNTAVNTEYGFNIDSLVNNGVRIERTQVIHPRKYGFVIGGGGTYSNFSLAGNTVHIDKAGVTGLILQGNVTAATMVENKIIAENAAAARSTAIRISPAGRITGGLNRNNIFQANQISQGLQLQLGPAALNCFFGNRDESSKPRKDMPDNHSGPCVTAAETNRPAAKP